MCLGFFIDGQFFVTVLYGKLSRSSDIGLRNVYRVIFCLYVFVLAVMFRVVNELSEHEHSSKRIS